MRYTFVRFHDNKFNFLEENPELAKNMCSSSPSPFWMYYEPLRERKRERSGKVYSLLNDHPFNDALGERISSWLYSQALVIAGEVTTRELFPRLQLTSCPVVASDRLSGISSVTGGQEISAATAIFQTFAIEREKERICTWQLNYDRSNDSRSVSSLLRVIRQCSSLSALIISLGAIHSDNSQYILCVYV